MYIYIESKEPKERKVGGFTAEGVSAQMLERATSCFPFHS